MYPLTTLASFGILGNVVTALTKMYTFKTLVALVTEGGEHPVMSAGLGHTFVLSARRPSERGVAL